MKVEVTTYENGSRCVSLDGIIVTEIVAEGEYYRPSEPYTLGERETLLDLGVMETLMPEFSLAVGSISEATDRTIEAETSDGCTARFEVIRLKPEVFGEGEYELDI